jgi:hypothetical protein
MWSNSPPALSIVERGRSSAQVRGVPPFPYAGALIHVVKAARCRPRASLDNCRGYSPPLPKFAKLILILRNSDCTTNRECCSLCPNFPQPTYCPSDRDGHSLWVSGAAKLSFCEIRSLLPPFYLVVDKRVRLCYIEYAATRKCQSVIPSCRENYNTENSRGQASAIFLCSVLIMEFIGKNVYHSCSCVVVIQFMLDFLYSLALFPQIYSIILSEWVRRQTKLDIESLCSLF